MSAVPPAVNGMSTRTGLVGQSSARIVDMVAALPTNASTTAAIIWTETTRFLICAMATFSALARQWRWVRRANMPRTDTPTPQPRCHPHLLADQFLSSQLQLFGVAAQRMRFREQSD